jgi:hypothetical protein
MWVAAIRIKYIVVGYRDNPIVPKEDLKTRRDEKNKNKNRKKQGQQKTKISRRSEYAREDFTE